MGEVKIPLSVVKELIDKQNEVHKVQLELLANHLKECAVLFEKALNPPIIPTEQVDPIVATMPRMSEEEEDWYFAYQQGDITKAELDKRLNNHFDGAYTEG